MEEVLELWPITPGLAQAIEDWGNAWQTQDGEPLHDAEAARLCRRLRDEPHHDIRVRVIYQP